MEMGCSVMLGATSPPPCALAEAPDSDTDAKAPEKEEKKWSVDFTEIFIIKDTSIRAKHRNLEA